MVVLLVAAVVMVRSDQSWVKPTGFPGGGMGGVRGRSQEWFQSLLTLERKPWDGCSPTFFMQLLQNECMVEKRDHNIMLAGKGSCCKKKKDGHGLFVFKRLGDCYCFYFISFHFLYKLFVILQQGHCDIWEFLSWLVLQLVFLYLTFAKKFTKLYTIFHRDILFQRYPGEENSVWIILGDVSEIWGNGNGSWWEMHPGGQLRQKHVLDLAFDKVMGLTEGKKWGEKWT